MPCQKILEVDLNAGGSEGLRGVEGGGDNSNAFAEWKWTGTLFRQLLSWFMIKLKNLLG